MKNIKERGFALILSLVLLLAMSLMGGALILITSEDHKSNNLVDVNQQTFYVAEMALLEGERYLTNQYNGPWSTTTHTRQTNLRNLPRNNAAVFDGTMTPDNNDKICRNSFNDLPNDLSVTIAESFNFGTFLENSNIPTGNDQVFLNNFFYEYFITRIGAANFRGTGSSAKRGSGGSGSGKNGMAYRVYGCGIYSDPNSNSDDQTVVTLESIVILPL
jgi:Tfp pilus assembly protein PilX|tara:strand:- start:749 stop:1399 length:651 start_codon:yes stop_codon:yes gene_type:complete